MKRLASISGPDLVRVLEDICRGNGITMNRVIKTAGISWPLVSRWRRGVNQPSQAMHDRISRALRDLAHKNAPTAKPNTKNKKQKATGR